MKCLNCDFEFNEKEARFCPGCGAEGGKKLTEGTENKRKKERQKLIDEIADAAADRVLTKAEEKRNAKKKESEQSGGSDDTDPLAGIL